MRDEPPAVPVDACERPRVLVVDDTAVNRTVAASWLERCGVEVTLAKDGAQAVRHVEEGADFDLVLMDLNMPVMNGYEATARIRRIEKALHPLTSRRLPILAFTMEDVREAELQNLGFDALIAKPFTVRELEPCLSQWCPGKVRRGREGELVPPNDARCDA